MTLSEKLFNVFMNTGVSFVKPFCKDILFNEEIQSEISKSLKNDLLLLPVETDDDYHLRRLICIWWSNLIVFNDTSVLKDGEIKNFTELDSLNVILTRAKNIYHGTSDFLNGRRVEDENERLINILVTEIKRLDTDETYKHDKFNKAHDKLLNLFYSLNLSIRMSFFVNFSIQKLIYLIPKEILPTLVKSKNPFGDYIPKELFENLPSSCFAINCCHDEHNFILGFVVQKIEDNNFIALAVLNNKERICSKLFKFDINRSRKINDHALYSFATFHNKSIEHQFCKNYYDKYYDEYKKGIPEIDSVFKEIKSIINIFLSSLFILQEDVEYEEKTKIFKEEERTQKIKINTVLKNKKKNKMLLFRKSMNKIDACVNEAKEIANFNAEYKKRVAISGSKNLSKRPHIRRGHIHTFWIGKRKDGAIQKSITKWLKPSFINKQKHILNKGSKNGRCKT